MAEEGNGQTETSTQTETIPAPIVAADGNFAENWPKMLTDQSLHDDKTLETFKNVESLAKSYVHVRKQVPMNKVVIPNEASTDEEWGEFHKAGGRPDTAADYNYVRPEALPEEHWNQDFANAAQEILFKGGASKKLADALLELNVQTTLATLKAKGEAEEAAVKEIEEALYRDWGKAFEQKKHLGNVAIQQGVTKMERVGTETHEVVDEEFKARLTDKFGNDPDFIRYSSNLGAKFAEHGDISVPGVPTPGDIQTQIDNEVANPAYSADYAAKGFTKQQHQAQVQKVSRLFQEKAAATKTG